MLVVPARRVRVRLLSIAAPAPASSPLAVQLAAATVTLRLEYRAPPPVLYSSRRGPSSAPPWDDAAGGEDQGHPPLPWPGRGAAVQRVTAFLLVLPQAPSRGDGEPDLLPVTFKNTATAEEAQRLREGPFDRPPPPVTWSAEVPLRLLQLLPADALVQAAAAGNATQAAARRRRAGDAAAWPLLLPLAVGRMRVRIHHVQLQCEEQQAPAQEGEPPPPPPSPPSFTVVDDRDGGGWALEPAYEPLLAPPDGSEADAPGARLLVARQRAQPWDAAVDGWAWAADLFNSRTLAVVERPRPQPPPPAPPAGSDAALLAAAAAPLRAAKRIPRELSRDLGASLEASHALEAALGRATAAQVVALVKSEAAAAEAAEVAAVTAKRGKPLRPGEDASSFSELGTAEGLAEDPKDAPAALLPLPLLTLSSAPVGHSWVAEFARCRVAPARFHTRNGTVTAILPFTPRPAGPDPLPPPPDRPPEPGWAAPFPLARLTLHCGLDDLARVLRRPLRGRWCGDTDESAVARDADELSSAEAGGAVEGGRAESGNGADSSVTPGSSSSSSSSAGAAAPSGEKEPPPVIRFHGDETLIGAILVHAAPALHDWWWGVGWPAIRLDTRVLARSPVPFPRTMVARRVFDDALTRDVATLTGSHKLRWAVMEAHAATGVVQLRCSSGGPVAAPCSVLASLLRRAVRSGRGPLYDGAVTWALDPTYPGDDLQLSEWQEGRVGE